MNLGEHSSTGATMSSVRDYKHGDGYRVEVASEGILFLEFGTGITYANPPHPKAAEMGYGPGTYGPKGATGDPWVYKDQFGNYWTTYGQAPSMPVYKSAKRLQELVETVANEVFK